MLGGVKNQFVDFSTSITEASCCLDCLKCEQHALNRIYRRVFIFSIRTHWHPHLLSISPCVRLRRSTQQFMETTDTYILNASDIQMKAIPVWMWKGRYVGRLKQRWRRKASLVGRLHWPRMLVYNRYNNISTDCIHCSV